MSSFVYILAESEPVDYYKGCRPKINIAIVMNTCVNGGIWTQYSDRVGLVEEVKYGREPNTKLGTKRGT